MWDFPRGYINFDKAAESNALIEQLVEEWLDFEKQPALTTSSTREFAWKNNSIESF